MIRAASAATETFYQKDPLLQGPSLSAGVGPLVLLHTIKTTSGSHQSSPLCAALVKAIGQRRP